MRLKANLKGKVIEGRLKTGNDLSVAQIPAHVVEDMIETSTDRGLDGPEGFEVRLGLFCFPKKCFAEVKDVPGKE